VSTSQRSVSLRGVSMTLAPVVHLAIHFEASSEMMRWLQSDYGMDARGAGIFLGQAVEYDLGNMFDPAYTMVCKVPKRLLPKRD